MIAARVQTHPIRAAMLPPLLAALAPLPVEVISDPEPDGAPNPWRCYQACLSDLPDCTHVLVIQDDALPCRNLPAAVESIAAGLPCHHVPVALFLGGRNFYTVREARRARSPYVRLHWHDPLPLVAMLWPKSLAEQFLIWARANPRATGRRNPRSDDAVGGVWMRRTRQEVLCTVPSLVEHPDTSPSLIKPRLAHGKRTAARFIGDADPLAIDWSLPPR